MQKKQIRIYIIHGAVDAESAYKDLCIVNQSDLDYELVWDSENPDYLVASELIYYHRRQWDDFVRVYSKAKIHIFFGSEAVEPDFNLFDYAVGFSSQLKTGDRYVRFPIRLLFSDLLSKRENDMEGKKEEAIKEYKRRKHFCDFIYSNANGHTMRKELFEAISQYQKVDALGKFCRNVSMPIDEKEFMGYQYYANQNLQYRKQYRFSIACENASFIGYTSEKIFTCLNAHTIPIYWGNPLIENDVNAKAFINVRNYKDFDELIDYIDEVNNNAELWTSYIIQPWLTSEQLLKEDKEKEMYQEFWNHIFMQDIAEARRLGEGFHPNWYRKWFWEY